jgi:uncharacterized protein (TIGR00369 family)
MYASRVIRRYRGSTPLLLDRTQIERIILDGLPIARDHGVSVTNVHGGPPAAATVCMPYSTGMVRPGNTVSGPSMMMLADAAMFAASLIVTNGNPLAVTTSLHIDFLRKPAAGSHLLAHAEMMKAGKRLLVMSVKIYASPASMPADAFDQAKHLVAFVSGTYSVPPGPAHRDIVV